MMQPAHAGMAITHEAFDKVLDHLEAVLLGAGVARSPPRSSPSCSHSGATWCSPWRWRVILWWIGNGSSPSWPCPSSCWRRRASSVPWLR